MSWLKSIDGFQSYSEYKRFLIYLKDRIAEGEIKEIPPEEYFLPGGVDNILNKDRWFKDCSSDEIWRLIPPDPPFPGFFEQVIYPLNKGVKE